MASSMQQVLPASTRGAWELFIDEMTSETPVRAFEKLLFDHPPRRPVVWSACTGSGGLGVNILATTIRVKNLPVFHVILTQCPRSLIDEEVSYNCDSMLSVAARVGSLEVVQALIEKRADIHHTNYHGENVRYIASFCRHQAVADYLREQGAIMDPIERPFDDPYGRDEPLYQTAKEDVPRINQRRETILLATFDAIPRTLVSIVAGYARTLLTAPHIAPGESHEQYIRFLEQEGATRPMRRCM